MSNAPRRRWLGIAGTLLLVATAGWWLRRHGLSSCGELERRVSALGTAGPLAFVLVATLGTVSFVPGTLLAVAGGVLFPPVEAALLVYGSSLLGALLAFLIARYVARDWARRFVERHPGYGAIAKRFHAGRLRYLLFLRFSPLFPFNALNYACALFPLRIGEYALATAVGILPGTVAYVYLGRLFGCALWERGAMFSDPAHRNAMGVFVGLTVLSLLPLLIKRHTPTEKLKGGQ